MNFMLFKARGKNYSRRALKKLGVTAEGCVIVSRTAKLGRGAVLCGPCIVSGESHICAGAHILPFSHIEDSFVGAGATVRASTVIGSEVGENSSVGPYAYLRGGAKVGRDCRVGDFVEIKNSALGDGSKAAHHAYIGDAEVGAQVNIGCGVVFANYDGKVKAKTKVGDGCFIGSNCNIVAPVTLGAGAYVAAGTTLTRDLQPLDFCIGREREKVKPQGAAGRYKNG